MIVLLMFTLALAIATAHENVVQTMRSKAPTIKRWGGRILIVVGGWFFALGIFASFFAEVFPV